MKQLGVLLLPLDGILVHHRAPSMKRVGVLLLSMDGILVHHRVPSMKRQGVLLLPPGWNASPSQGTQHDETRSITTRHGWDTGPSQGYLPRDSWHFKLLLLTL